MKTKLFIAAFLITCTAGAQDSLKRRAIDALVTHINTSNFKTKVDTINNDQPQVGLSIRSYLTTVTDGTELKKYVNKVHASTLAKSASNQMVSTNSFNFDHKKLIKVEESFTEEGRKGEALWYYADDKLIFHSRKSDDAGERAAFLLNLAKGMLTKWDINSLVIRTSFRTELPPIPFGSN